MKYYWNALITEFLKLRRTLAFWCILIGPTTVTFLYYASLFSREPGTLGAKYNAWQVALDNGMGLWAMLFMPLYVALQATLVAQLEHGNQQWKYLYALPVPRFAYFAAKWSVVTLVLLITNLLLTVEMVAGGLLTEWLKPGWGFNAAIPWAGFAGGFAGITAAALLLLSIHLLVSLWWRSFIPSLGLGLVAAMSNIFIAPTDQLYRFDPWLMPGMALRGEGSDPQIGLIAGVTLGLLLALVGGWFFIRKPAA
jgi:hypothetical protein